MLVKKQKNGQATANDRQIKVSGLIFTTWDFRAIVEFFSFAGAFIFGLSKLVGVCFLV